MTKTPNMENWGRSKAKQRYAEGGSVQSVSDGGARNRGYAELGERMREDRRKPREYPPEQKEQMNKAFAISQGVRRTGDE